MKFKFSIRSLLLLPLLVGTIFQLAIHVEFPKKWPEERWLMELVDSNGKVLSVQDEDDRPTQPSHQPGKYRIRSRFPGFVDAVVNLFAKRRGSAAPGLVINVDAANAGPMVVADESGKIIRTCVDGFAGPWLSPGRYTLSAMTEEQVIEYREEMERAC